MAHELAESLSDRYPRKEYVWNSEIRVVQAAKGQLPVPQSFEHKLDRVRIRNEQDTRVVQIADDRIVVSQLKSQEQWPGFETLLNDTLELVDRYSAVFQPAAIRLAILHDVDIVDIPVCAGAEVEMDEYLTIVKELPRQPFGLIQGYFNAYVTKAPLDQKPFQIVAQLIPSPPDSQVIRFRLDWEKRCGNVDFSTNASIRTGLQASHCFMVECFRTAFTPKCLQLFDPVET